MSDLAEQILTAIEAKETAENDRTKDMIQHACPTCDQHADRYSIERIDDKDAMHSDVKLFPCEDIVDWSTIKRIPVTISKADEDVLRRCAADRELVELWRVPDPHEPDEQCESCLALQILARGYGIQP